MYRKLGTSRHLALLVLWTVAPMVSSASGAEQPLRWKFKPGQTLDYVLERGAEGKMNLSGSEIAFKMGMAFDVAWTAKSVDTDGAAQVELKIDRIQISMNSPLVGNLAYDSASGEPLAGLAAAPMEPLISGMLGQAFRVKISALGRVSDIELPQKLTDVFAKQQQGGNRQAGFGIGGNALSAKGIRELIEKSVLPLPEAAPAKEVTWNQHFDNPIPRAGVQMSDVTYSFAGNDSQDGRPLTKISAATEITFEPEENAQADVEITAQDSTATYLFDQHAGHLFKGSGVQTFVLEMSGAQEIKQDMKETMSIRLGKSDPPKPKSK